MTLARRNSSNFRKRSDYLVKRQSHSDGEMRNWPGVPVTEADVVKASGHRLDKLSLEDRLDAHRAVTAGFLEHYPEREIVEQWRFELIIAGMGRGKTTLASIDASYEYGCLGVPVFHTGELLFGRKLAANEVYSAITRIPDNSILFIDEAPVYFGIGMDNSRASRLMQQSLAGLRKKNCHLILATATDHLLARGVKRETSQVLVPWIPKLEPAPHDSLRDIRRKRLGLKNLYAAPRGSNFYRLVWDTIGSPERPPFKERSLLTEIGLEPDPTALDEQEIIRRVMPPIWVRQGKLLNDSFRPVNPLVQYTIDNDEITADQAAHLYGEGGAGASSIPDGEAYKHLIGAALGRVYGYLVDQRIPDGQRLPYQRLGDIADVPKEVAQEMRNVLIEQMGVKMTSAGFRADDLKQAMAPSIRESEVDDDDES